MDTTQRQLIKKYVDLVLERWRLIAACLLLAVTTGLIFYLFIPKSYQSTATLSYEQQQINPTRMDPEQGRNQLKEAVATLQEVVLSRNSLEKVINQFSLYEKERKRLPIEDVIEEMRKKDISIVPANRGDIFSVSFQGQDPDKVMKVTNALASQFIEENLKYRGERATETSKYTSEELQMAKKVMDEKEQLMRDYKLKHYNELPEQRESNMARLIALNDQSQRLQEAIQNLERTKIMAQEQVAMLRRLSAASAGSGSAQPGESASRQTLTDAERLQQLRRHYSTLQIKYTEKHPEVVRTKQLIEQLESRVGKEPSAEQRTTTRIRGSAGAGNTNTMEIGRQQIQLSEYEANLRQLRADLAALPAEIAKYKGWIEATPVREAEWNGLTRDYNELKRHYDELVARNLQAQSTETLERKQKGSKFKIVDPARKPDKPSKPNFLKIFLAAVGLGLGLGFGCTFLLDFIDTSFKDAAEIEEYVGIPVICAVPHIAKEEESRRKKFIFTLSLTLFSLYGLALLAAIAFLWLKGKIII